MFFHLVIKRILIILLCSFAIVSYACAQNEIPEGKYARPKSVPEEFVITPNGYFHPSCVHEIKNDEVLQPGLIVEKRNGEKRHLDKCRFSRFSSSGEEIKIGKTGQSRASFTDGWQLYADYTLPDNSNLGAMVVDWTVPVDPDTAREQTIFFFPGVQQSPEDATLLSALGWNQLNISGWSLANWNCCEKGTAIYSTPIRTFTGQNNHVDISWDSKKKNYTIISSVGTQITVLETSAYQEQVNWVLGGVMALYGVEYCSDLRMNGYISFRDIYIQDRHRDGMKTAFNPVIKYPLCNYNVNVSGSPLQNVEIKF